MVHAFDCINNKNGNITVTFREDNKLRQIILTKRSAALSMFEDYMLNDLSDKPSEVLIKEAIIFVKKIYYFKANENNKSIFRPIAKSLILKDI
jgi:hypothetical protein